MLKINSLPIERELENKNFYEGLKLLNLKESDFKFNEGDFGNGIMYDLDCVCICEGVTTLVTYTINDDRIKDVELLEDIKHLDGYWHISEEC